VQQALDHASTGQAGERRQLTVLFCDMVGFTELAGRVDPEILQKIIRSYEDACAVCITRYAGYVFQRLGEGIVALFGYPLAHEGEAERATPEATLARHWVAEADAIARENAMNFMSDMIIPLFDGCALIEDGAYEEGYARAAHGMRAWP
jgi:class 3 adenylate cyclase